MNLTSIPVNPVPDGATAGTVKSSDGVVLRYVRFEPPAGCKGTLRIFPDRAELIEKYFEVVRDARAALRKMALLASSSVARLPKRGSGHTRIGQLNKCK